MLGGTGLLMAAGSFMLWDLATSVVRHADRPNARRTVPEPGTPRRWRVRRPRRCSSTCSRATRSDTLMHSFSRMLVDHRAAGRRVNEYARRLDTAYKELESTSAQLKEFSFKDEVTGLYNRRFFSIRLEEEVSRYRRFNHPVSVVLLDLDGFKAVNDELGHAAGDETLRGMAEILLKQSRGINVICRYGGDEFAVLLVETSKSGARLYADRIRYVLSDVDLRPRPPGDRELRHRVPARGRGARRRRADPRRRRGALRGQARRQEPRLGPRGHGAARRPAAA